VTGSLFGLGAWWAVAHNSGAGWVQSLGALLAGFLLLGLVAPAFATRRLHCEALASPTDATAGSPCPITISANGAARIRPTYPGGNEALTGRDKTCELTLLPARRGVLTTCQVEIASAAPFGLLWWAKVVTVPLPRPICVAPRIGPADSAVLASARGSGEEERRGVARVGEPRGVREYRPGDLRHWVHWPATAHTGNLMVREMEAPLANPVLIRVLLPDDPERADEEAGRVLGTVSALLNTGRGVVLQTLEAIGPVSAAVGSTTAAGRRLARALPEIQGPAGPRERRRDRRARVRQ